jgi:integrase/recombinase XerD
MGEMGRRFRQHMVLRGFAEATKESYEYALVDLVRAYEGTSPDLLNCAQVQAHVARLIGERHLAWSTVNVYVSAYRLFFHELLKRPDAEFSLPRRGKAYTRPHVLDRASVQKILAAHTNIKHRALLAMVYGSGLRVSEVCRLKPRHIESAPDRMMVRVEQSKGRKDRYTLLSYSALALLREYWLKERPGEWLFPHLWRPGPMSNEGALHIYHNACDKVGISRDRGHGIHTLRHCFASHLMEDGVALPVIQRLLGHRDLSTTSVYCHVSRALLENVRSPGDRLADAK